LRAVTTPLVAAVKLAIVERCQVTTRRRPTLSLSTFVA